MSEVTNYLGKLGHVALHHTAEDILTHKRYKELERNCEAMSLSEKFVVVEPIRKNLAKLLVSELYLKEEEYGLITFGEKLYSVEDGSAYMGMHSGFDTASMNLKERLSND